MGIECNLITSVLKLTKNGCISSVLISKEANVPTQTGEKLLLKLQNAGLISARDGFVEATPSQRADLAIYAINQGVDRLKVSLLLSWREFESIAAITFEKNGYVTTKNYIFKQEGRRWEIDVVGFRKPLLICADCKHWNHGLQPSSIQKITEEQVARTKALSFTLDRLFERINCSQKEKPIIIPIVLSLFSNRLKFCAGTPIVPVVQMNDFLDQLPTHCGSLFHVPKGCDNNQVESGDVKTGPISATPKSSFKGQKKRSKDLSEFL